MPRIISQDDFFSMKELHFHVLNEFFMSDAIFSKHFCLTSREGNYRYDKSIYELNTSNSDLMITMQVTKNNKNKVLPWFDIKKLQYKDTLDFFEIFFKRKNVLVSTTTYTIKLDSKPTAIPDLEVECQIIISEKAWDKLLQSRVIQIGSYNINLEGNSNEQRYLE